MGKGRYGRRVSIYLMLILALAGCSRNDGREVYSGTHSESHNAAPANGNSVDEPEASALSPEAAALPPLSREEIVELFPYIPPQLINTEPHPNLEYLFYDTSQGRMLANYIFRITAHRRVPFTEGADKFFLHASLSNTKPASVEERQTLAPYISELRRNFKQENANIYSGLILLPEHVEQTAKRIFGDEATVTHEDGAGWRYNEGEQVYYGVVYGQGDYDMPVILDCREEEDRYEIVVAFLYCSGWTDDPYQDQNGNSLHGQEVQGYLMNEAPQYKITLRKQEDSLLFIAQDT